MFLGPGGHVSPHESVYRGKGILWGPETTEVKRYFERAGFRFGEGFQGIPDHISLELEFMSQLAREEGEAWEVGDAAKAGNSLVWQADFLKRHLGTWARSFCARVVERAELPFYRDLSLLMADFLEAEAEEIDRRLQAVHRQDDP